VGDRIAFPDCPFDSRNAAVTRQQRGVITDTSELCRGQGFPADARVAVRRHDQVGAVGDLGSHDKLGIGLHSDFDTGGAGRCGEPVFGVGNHDACDVDTVLPQHVQRGHAEMAGADEGDPHGSSIRFERGTSSVDNMSQASVTPPLYAAAGYQQDAAQPNSRGEGNPCWLTGNKSRSALFDLP